MLVMSRTQLCTAVIGLLTLAISLIFVPFEATYVQKGDNSRADIGYHLIWSPPDPVEICVKTFGMHVYALPKNSSGLFDDVLKKDTVQDIIHRANRLCHARPIYSQIFTSSAAIIIATLAFFLLAGAFRRRA